MRISRPCYNKPHRCPGWAGGGWKYAKVSRCDGGHLPDSMYYRRLWQFRSNRCDTCAVVVLPYAVRLVDPTWWADRIRCAVRDLRYRLKGL